MNKAKDMREAGFWVRVAAFLIDILTIYFALKAAKVILEQFGIFDHFELIVIICLLTYLTLFVGTRSRTIGKILCGLTVRSINNKSVGYFRAFLREVIGKFISCVFFLAGFFWVGLFRSKRGWHDYIARTAVEQDMNALKRRRIVVTFVFTINILFISLMIGWVLTRVNNLQKKNVLRPDAINVTDLTNSQHETFVNYLKENGKPPIDYVVSKFKQHDVIILGEEHQVQETCNFISELIKPLYHQVGVRILAMEVLKYKNESIANRLVTKEVYDEESVLHLFRDYAYRDWGYQEYMDIFKAIWQFNQTLPPNAQKFKIIGLDSNWDGYALRKGRPLWKLPGNIVRTISRDKFMAKVLSKKVLTKGEKALVYIGAAHSFTRYRQPQVKKGKLVAEWPRFGCILYKKYASRIFQVWLHKWSFSPDLVNGNLITQQPLGGFLEEIFAKNNNVPVGFDIEKSPFAFLRDSNEYYFAYQNYVVFSDITQGYLFLKPLKELHAVTWAKGFINEENFELWEDFLAGHGLTEKGKCQTNDELNECMRRRHNEKMNARKRR